jgi:hypothetical protein
VNQDVQVASQHDEDAGGRVYQLSPQPDTLWWQTFHAVAGRRLDEVGMHPPASVETGHSGDEIRISGITPETSVATDQWLTGVISATNRESRPGR